MEEVTTTREPTLSDLLHSFVQAHIPARFYLVLQLAVPLAFQFASHGWWRLSGFMAFASAFGAWGLFEQRATAREELGEPAPWAVAGRASAGVVASVLGVTLLLELFVRIMALMFNCPGCAG